MSRLWYYLSVRFLFATPPTNDRGPKFMEKALAAIHQAIPATGRVICEFGEHEGRVGLIVSCPDDLMQVVTSPIIANYPQSILTLAPLANVPADWSTWNVEFALSRDLFPILRHTQFEDLANRSFADPIDGLLRAATPTSTLRCNIKISISRTPNRAQFRALEAVRRLNGPFLRHHHRIGHWYAGDSLCSTCMAISPMLP